MTDEDTNEPVEGEITGPDGSVSPAPKGKKGAGPKKPATGKGFGRQQTDKEREQEDEKSSSFPTVVARGEGWWKGPGWEPNENDKLMVQMLKFSGYTDEDIAGALHMSVETLIKHFAWELKNSKMMIMGDLATRAYTRARQGNDVLMMFLLKTRSDGAFSERTQQVAALADNIEGEPDQKKRAELVSKILDIIDTKKAKNTTKEDGKK